MDKRRIAVRAIIWHNNKLLAVKHKTKQGGESAYWALPGGGLNPLESLTDGIKRELLEETGTIAEVGKLLHVQQLQSDREDSNEELEFFFHITNPADFTSIHLEKTTHGNQELAKCEFVDPSSVYILPSFLSTVNLKEQVETNQPVLVADNLNEILQ